jgi:hypothetical protein
VAVLCPGGIWMLTGNTINDWALAERPARTAISTTTSPKTATTRRDVIVAALLSVGMMISR